MLDELDYDSMTAVKRVNELYDKTVEMQNNVTANLDELKEEIQEVKNISETMNNDFLKKDAVLSESQMPPTIINNSIQSLNHIMTSIIFNEGTLSYSIKDMCREEDFVVAIKRNVSNQLDKLLIRDVDYRIYNTFNSQSKAYEDTILSITSSLSQLMSTGDIIILTGIKIGKVGR